MADIWEKPIPLPLQLLQVSLTRPYAQSLSQSVLAAPKAQSAIARPMALKRPPMTGANWWPIPPLKRLSSPRHKRPIMTLPLRPLLWESRFYVKSRWGCLWSKAAPWWRPPRRPAWSIWWGSTTSEPRPASKSASLWLRVALARSPGFAAR